MRIAHLCAEVAPFAKTGGLGDVTGALPAAQAELGHETSVWMPYYRTVRRWLGERGIHPDLAAEPFRIELGFQSFQVGLLKSVLPGSSVPVYFVGSDPHFDRPHLYSPAHDGRDDGLIRYAVFVRAVLEAMRRLRLVPDVLHAHDWHTTLAPMALRWDRPRDWHFERTVTVLTVHNMAYQGVYSPELFVYLGLPRETFSDWGLRWDGAVNLMKGGLLSADAITAVSPTFAREIMTPEGGFGLDAVVRYRARDLVGIVNGIDPKVWNPAVDPKIPRRYSRDNLEGKLENRRALLARAGMAATDRSFVIGIVGRLTAQKGYDLFFPVLGELLAGGTRFVFLGSGDAGLENQVRAWSNRAWGRFWGHVGFDDELAHLIEAGADAFLMPSRFEPCGLNQLYSLAYGTPPIVRRVGGLADTVIPYDGTNANRATGFAFDAPEPWALRDAVAFAARCYQDMRLWTQLVRNGMAQDWSWRRSAEKYLEVYQRLLARRPPA